MSKTKPGYGPTVSAFLRDTPHNLSADHRLTKLPDESAVAALLKDRSKVYVFYKEVGLETWRRKEFSCKQQFMERLYVGNAVKAAAGMVVRHSIWVGKGSPHFPIRGQSAIMLAWSQYGWQLQLHEMQGYPQDVDAFQSAVMKQARDTVSFHG